MKPILSIYATAIGCAWVAVSANAMVRYVNVGNASPTPPYTNWATAANVIQDAVDVALSGDEIVVTNGVYQTGGRTVHGTVTNRVALIRPITLRSVNGPKVTVIRGHQIPSSTNGEGAMRCAYLTGGAALIGFTLTNGATWAGPVGPLPWNEPAYRLEGGGVLCDSASATVSNCVLTGNSAAASGGAAFRGRLENCLILGNSAHSGGGVIACTLINCVLRENSGVIGGGASEATLNKCTLIGNSAIRGGGAFWSTLNDCTLIGNFCSDVGGGAYGGALNNCTITGNFAGRSGGGASDEDPENPRHGGLNNCIVFYNVSPSGANYSGVFGGTLNYSCTMPLPTNGIGNITNAPLFLDAAIGNFRLQSYSPCINAGRNGDAPTGFDLDGNPRIAGGTVDIGAYEFQSPQSTISYAWLQQYGLLADGSADSVDGDSDGLNNWEEWRAWTDPTNSASALRLLRTTVETNGVMVRWQSVSGHTYRLERSSNLIQRTFQPIATNIIAQSDATTYADTNAAATRSFFYRVSPEE